MTVTHHALSFATGKRSAGQDSREIDVDEAGVSGGIRYTCDYCYKDISGCIRIQCAECGKLPEPTQTEDDHKIIDTDDGDNTKSQIKINTAAKPTLDEVDLCVECFCAGVEMNDHLATHSYRILKPLDFAVYSPDWRADEELLLLEACESNGVGNWEDISEQLGGNVVDGKIVCVKSAEECRDHYMQTYVEQGNHPKPLPPSAQQTKIRRTSTKPSTGGGGFGSKQQRTKLKHNQQDEGKDDRPLPLEPPSNQPIPQSMPATHEIAGYMPKRDECEVEIENEAEMAIKDLQFLEPFDVDSELKYSLLEGYCNVLLRRASRHAFITSHQLTDFKRQQQLDKQRSSEESRVYAQIRPFCRFMRPSDFKIFFEGLVHQKLLVKQIERLQQMRRDGLRSFSEVEAWERERKHFDLYLKGGGGGAAKKSGGLVYSTGMPSQEPHPLPHPSQLTLDHLQQNAFSPPPPSNTPHSSSSTSTTTMSPPTAIAATVSTLHQPHTITPPNNGGRKASTPLNISHAEGIELLSEKERHLCSILRLYPRLYLGIKDTLIKEHLKHGGLKRAQARGAVKIDVNKTSKLYDFFIAAGWIKPPASGE